MPRAIISSKGQPTLATAYNVQGGLGGISTADGGNVTLIAGGNVSSVLPEAAGNGYEYDGNSISDANKLETETAGSGAYGRDQGRATSPLWPAAIS